MISFDYDVDYKPSALVRTQRLSLIPKIPQLEGMHIPSPDVDPHKMSLIKLLLFKPLAKQRHGRKRKSAGSLQSHISGCRKRTEKAEARRTRKSI